MILQSKLKHEKRLEESEKRHHMLLMQSPFAFAVLKGKDMVVAMANDSIKQMWGKGNKIEGKPLLEVLPEIKDQEFPVLLQKVYTTGNPYVSKESLARVKRKGKMEDVYFNFVYQPYCETDDTISGVTIIAIEVTEQVNSKKIIEESEEKYRSLFNSLHDAFCIIEMIFNEKAEPIDWIYVETNPAFSQHATMEMNGKRISEIVPEIEAFWLEKYGDVAKTGVTVQLENKVKGLGDQWFQTSAFRHGPEGSNRVAVLFRNITERKAAEEKIKESEKQLALDLANSKKLQTISTQLIHEENIDLLYEQLIDAAIALMRSDMASIQLFHSEKNQLELLKHRGFHPESAAHWQWISTTSKSVCSAAQNNGERSIVSDIEKDKPMSETGSLNYYQLSGIRAMQSTPLISRNGDLVGMISTHWREPHEPSEKDLQLFDVLVRQAADFIERKTIAEKLKESEKQQAFLLKLSDALRPLSNPIDIEEAATKIAMNFIDADWCHYVTVKEDNLVIQRGASRDGFPSLTGVYPTSSFTLFNAALDTGIPTIIDDVHTTDILDEDLKKLCIQLQNIAIVIVPIIKNEKPAGLLVLVQSKPRKWTDTEVQLTIETSERTWAAIERAKAEQALQQSEEKYRMLFSSIDEAVSTIDIIFDANQKAVDFLFIENNSAFAKLTGLPENVIGKRWLEFVPAIDPYVADIFERVIRTGESVRAENYVESLDKWHNTFFTLFGGVGSNRIICVYSDITERKQTEEKIKESEKRFRDIADASSVLIWTFDANGFSAFYNKTFLDFIGASKDENISDWGKIVHPDDVQSTFETINTAIAGRHSYSLECRLLRADGQWRWVMAQGNPRMGTNNEFLGFVGSSVDITERKQYEYEIMQAKTSAENSAMSRQQFLSTMSHEIRTPLNSILGFANVLLKTELDPEQMEFVQAIKTSGKSLNLLINDILDLAKVDAGKMTFVKQPFEIRKSITSILHSFVMKIKEKNIELVEEYDNNIPPILLGDSLRLNQILFNLISNAVKFTAKGKIKLTVELLNETEDIAMLKFVVSDSGIGISANKLNSIFNVFEQAEHSTYTSYGGTGLGLAIVKQLVESQGGSMSVKSKLGEGSTFGFIMSFGKTNIKLKAEIEILKPDPEIKNVRVLVAEDVPLNQVLIKIILNDFKFEQEIVSNGKLAIEKMQTNTYDIILMDLQMPEMNGFEATEYIRNTMKSQIPIIALTADVTTVDISKCQEFGMDDYISKPMNENLLYSKIVELVNRSK